MSEEMIELRRLVEQWDATSEFATDDLYLFTEALVGATRAALSAYNPNERLREALVEARHWICKETGRDDCRLNPRQILKRIDSALSPLPQGEDR